MRGKRKRKDLEKTLARRHLVRTWTMGIAIALVVLGCIAAGAMLATGLRHEPEEPSTVLDHPPQIQTTPTETPTEPTETVAPVMVTTPTTEPLYTEPPVPPTEPDSVQLLMESMTLWEKVCQLFIAVPEDLSQASPMTEPEDTLIDALTDYPVGGVVFFRENLVDDAQCAALLENFQESSRIPLLLCVDEEGGLVSRLGVNDQISVTYFPPMEQISSKEEAYQVGATLGRELRALGFGVDFAPVADVNSNPDNTVIGSRAFGTDPAEVGTMIEACVTGFQDAGVISCLKHFPGHGDTMADSHDGSVFSNKTLDELRSAELIPFSRGIAAGAPAVMVGHISLPNVTGGDIPATFSETLLQDVLRQELGFKGMIVTDAMNMGAITDHYKPGEAAVLALQAGCDLILMPEDLDAAVNAVYEAVNSGTISVTRIEESVERILRVKEAYDILLP